VGGAVGSTEVACRRRTGSRVSFFRGSERAGGIPSKRPRLRAHGTGVRRRLLSGFLLLAGVFVAGTVGYHLIEGASLWDAFYMTAITLTTVGYHEVFPLSRVGQGFTIALLFAGLGLLFFVALELVRWLLEGELRELLGHARRSRMIERLSGHEIVCGWGRMGQAVVAELIRDGRAVVVVERQADKLRRLREMRLHALEGDATSESILRAAGVARARGLVVCLNDDANNVYTVLTARSLSPNLFIVARAGGEGAESRMFRAGANRVVNPYQLGGIRLAHLLVKPAVVDFLDLSLSPVGEELEIEQLRLAGAGPLIGTTLAEVDLRKRWGVGVVAVQRATQLFPTPAPDFRLEAGDVLVVIGSRERLARFEAEVCV